MLHPEFTIVTDSVSALDAQKHIDLTGAVAAGAKGIVADMARKGYSVDAAALKKAMDADPDYKAALEQYAKDAGFELGDANIDALGQFFLVWNETEINRLYRGRTAIQTFGVKTMGDWLTEKIIFKLRELSSGGTALYDDFTRAPYSNYNYGYDSRDTLRLEWALEVMKREEMVGSVMRRNPYKDKKDAILLAQEIWENKFFWNGATVGSKKLYGVLSEPGVAGRKSNMMFDLADADITPDKVIAELRRMKQQLANDLDGNGDIETLPVQIACPILWQTAFTAVSEDSINGWTANKWLAENWKSATVSFKPELNDADDGDPMMIVFAQSVPGVGLDTVNLARTSALRLVGAMPTLKGREEAYSASVAGALIACPLGIRFWTAPGSSSAS